MVVSRGGCKILPTSNGGGEILNDFWYSLPIINDNPQTGKGARCPDPTHGTAPAAEHPLNRCTPYQSP